MGEQYAPASKNKAYMLLLVPIIALNLWGGLYAISAATSEMSVQFDLSNDKALSTQGTTTIGSAHEPTVPSTAHQLIVSASSTTFTYNGRQVESVQPVVYKKGYYYVPVATMAKLVGLNLSYDSKTKEMIVSDNSTMVRFKSGSRMYTANDASNMMEAPAITHHGSTMITIGSWACLTGSTVVKEGKSFSLTWHRPDVK